MNKKSLVLYTIATALILFGAAAYFYGEQQTEEKTSVAAANSASLTQFYSPRLGATNAKVTLVEFMDPACETCGLFHPFVKQLLAKYEGKLNLVVRYAPFHPGSDITVKMLEAARKQGKFWDVLELMFDTQEGWASHHQPQPEKLWDYLDYYKFDTAQMKKDMADPAFDKIIATDLADAGRLGVQKTPTYFVNGKPLPSFGHEQLQELVESEIAINY